MPTTYEPPRRKDISVRLLRENYNDHMEDVTKKVLVDANLFELTVFGDGGTIVKCLLTHILFACECFCFYHFDFLK